MGVRYLLGIWMMEIVTVVIAVMNQVTVALPVFVQVIVVIMEIVQKQLFAVMDAQSIHGG